MKLLHQLHSYLNDFVIFIFIFGFYNDDFMVKYFGEFSLKITIMLAFILNLSTFIKNLRAMTQLQEKLFFIFLLLEMTLLLSQLLMGYNVDFAPAGYMLIAIFIIVVLFIRYPIKKIVYIIWLAMMISVVIAYFQVPPTLWDFRKSGGTEDPNEFATQLLVFLFAAFYLYTQNKSKLFIITSIIFFIYGIIHAASKSSFLMLGILAIICIIRLIMINPKFFINYKFFFSFLLLLGIVAQINFTKVDAITNLLSRTKDSGTALFRIHSWEAGVHMVEQNPIFGVGPNSFAKNEPLYEDGHMIGSAPAPHSIYVEMIAESGIPIFILFIIFLGYIVKKNFNFFLRNTEWWILVMLFVHLLMGLTLGFLYDKYFWLVIALVMNLNHQLKQKGYLS